MTNVVETLQATVLEQQEATAIAADREISFSRLWSLTDQFAGGLRDRDVTAGDAIGICLSSPVEFLVAAYGAMRNGSVPVVIPTSYGSDAIERVAEDTDAQGLVLDESKLLSIVLGISEMRFAVTVDTDALLGVEFEAFLGEQGINAGGSRTGLDVIGRRNDDPALVTYLDRPGEPVATVRSHGSLDAAAAAGADAVADEPVRRHLGCLPLVRSSAFAFGATATLFGGGRYCAMQEWDPEHAAARLLGGAIDRTYVTPEQYEALRAEGLDAGNDAVAVLDPTPDAADATADGSTRLCGTPETGITHVRTPTDVQQQRIGTPLDGARVRVVGDDDGDRGQLAVAGDTVVDGYYERPSLTAATVEELDGDEWIRTDATGTVEDGEVYLAA